MVKTRAAGKDSYPWFPGHSGARTQSGQNLFSMAMNDGISASALRCVPKGLHSILGWLQSIPKRFVPRANCPGILGRMDSLLFVRYASFQPMGLERVEALCCFPSSTSSRLRATRGDRLHTQGFAPFNVKTAKIRSLLSLNPAASSLLIIPRAASAQDRSVQLSRLELLLQS
jgi:hypothetical protein